MPMGVRPRAQPVVPNPRRHRLQARDGRDRRERTCRDEQHRQQAAPPVTILPISRCRPLLVSGAPIAREIQSSSPLPWGIHLAIGPADRGGTRDARRPRGDVPETPHEIRAGELLVVPQERRAHFRDAEIDLTAREFDVLAALAERPGWVLSAEQLADSEGPADYASPYAVSVHISHLRAQLSRVGARALVETVRGTGWRLRRRGGAVAGLRPS